MGRTPALAASGAGVAWALGAVGLWGTSSAVIVLLGTLPAGELLLCTHAVGALALNGWCLYRRGVAATLAPARALTPRLVGIALLGTVVYQLGYVSGLRLAPPAQANLLNYLWPLCTALFAALLGRDRLTFRHLAAMLVGIGGTALLVGTADAAGYPDATYGYALAITGAVAWGLYSNLIARLPASPADSQRLILTVGAAAFVPVALMGGISVPTPAEAVAAAYLGLGPVALGAVAWQGAMSRGPVASVVAVAYLTPALSTGLLVALAGRAATWSLAAGLALVLLAAVLPGRRT